MRLILRGFAIGSLLLTATQDLSAMCLATPCYLLEVSIVSTAFPEGSASCLLDGTLLSSKQVECTGVNSYRSFNPSTFDSDDVLPESISFPLRLNEDRSLCESIRSRNNKTLLYVFQDCCDTPGRSCLRGYQAKIVGSEG